MRTPTNFVGPTLSDVASATITLAQDAVISAIGYLEDGDDEGYVVSRARLHEVLDNMDNDGESSYSSEQIEEAHEIVDRLEIPDQDPNVAPEPNTPFRTPVYVSSGNMLCGADHELVCRMDSATVEEARYLADCVNAGARALGAERYVPEVMVLSNHYEVEWLENNEGPVWKPLIDRLTMRPWMFCGQEEAEEKARKMCSNVSWRAVHVRESREVLS